MLTQLRVPHPLCVLCAKVGRPLTSIPTVNTTAESALVGWERRLVPRTTVVDRGFRREPGASAPGKSANFEGLQAPAFAPLLRQEARTTVVLEHFRNTRRLFESIER